jgi:hypothetical protein
MATGHVDVVDHHVISGWVCPPQPVLIVVNGRTEDVAEWGGPRDDARQDGHREAIGSSCRLARHLKPGPNRIEARLANGGPVLPGSGVTIHYDPSEISDEK